MKHHSINGSMILLLFAFLLAALLTPNSIVNVNRVVATAKVIRQPNYSSYVFAGYMLYGNQILFILGGNNHD